MYHKTKIGNPIRKFMNPQYMLALKVNVDANVAEANEFSFFHTIKNIDRIHDVTKNIIKILPAASGVKINHNPDRIQYTKTFPEKNETT